MEYRKIETYLGFLEDEYPGFIDPEVRFYSDRLDGAGKVEVYPTIEDYYLMKIETETKEFSRRMEGEFGSGIGKAVQNSLDTMMDGFSRTKLRNRAGKYLQKMIGQGHEINDSWNSIDCLFCIGKHSWIDRIDGVPVARAFTDGKIVVRGNARDSWTGTEVSRKRLPNGQHACFWPIRRIAAYEIGFAECRYTEGEKDNGKETEQL